MKTNVNPVPASRDPRRPLLLHTRAAFRRRDLASARRGTFPRPQVGGGRAVAAEIQAAREAAMDRRTVRELVLDTVVERLLDELGG
jgi:hypothetical protein